MLLCGDERLANRFLPEVEMGRMGSCSPTGPMALSGAKQKFNPRHCRTRWFNYPSNSGITMSNHDAG